MNQVTFIEKESKWAISGPLTFDTVKQILKDIVKDLSSRKGRVAIDFSQVTRCDSASFALITCVLREAKKNNLDLCFMGFSDQLTQLIRVGGLDSILPVCTF